MPRIIDRTGEKHINKQGSPFTIIECHGNEYYTVLFDNGYVCRNVSYINIKNKSVKNPYHPSVYGVGYIGVGDYKISIKGKITKTYSKWSEMIRRCYHEPYHEKFPTYIGCSIAKEWHNFQIFAKWYEENYKEEQQLDKDILIKGNKIYSPETCCFIPQDVNKLFTRRQNGRGDLPIGVHFDKESKKFAAQISKSGKREFLGYFKTAKEAFYAYKTAKEEWIKIKYLKLNTNNYGKFQLE